MWVSLEARLTTVYGASTPPFSVVLYRSGLCMVVYDRLRTCPRPCKCSHGRSFTLWLFVCDTSVNTLMRICFPNCVSQQKELNIILVTSFQVKQVTCHTGTHYVTRKLSVCHDARIEWPK